MALSEIDPLLDILLLYFFPFLFYIGLYWTFNVVLVQVYSTVLQVMDKPKQTFWPTKC